MRWAGQVVSHCLMDDIFNLLQNYEVVIYVVLGLAALFPLRRAYLVWQEYRAAQFGLERELAQRRITASLAMFFLLSLLIAAEFFMASFVIPARPRPVMLATPTLDLLATPETAAAAGPTAEALAAAPAGAAAPAAPAAPPAEGCIPGQLEWTLPQNGGEISGLVELRGTIMVGNLGFYKYEFSQPGSDSWVTIAAGNQPLQDQPLGGMWNTADLIPGDYLLRLVVTDNQNQPFPICQITTRVVAPEEE